jgi:tetratricopeptide (TPR) repeat protein
MSGAPFISATLIVRDEAHHLPDCLASLRGFADEVIVVDTGSVDDTVAIAEAAGATVRHFPWCEDFSAARNVAIEHARGDWLLYIDADERVRPYDLARLRLELADPALFCTTVRFHPRTGSTAYREYRLLRRRPDVRFEGAMHESFLPSLFRAMEAHGGRIGEVEVTLDHVGYDGDQSHKLERNRTLLEKQIRATPARVFLWWHLGTVYRDLDRLEDADTAWGEATRLATLRGGQLAEDALGFIELAKAMIERDEDPIPVIEQGLVLRPENLMLHWLKGRALMDRAPDEAMAIFERLAEVDPDTFVSETAYDRRMLGAGARSDMGYCAFRSGDYAAAARHYALAEAREPGNLEYRMKRRVAEARAAASETP